jgi:hypothetical protein
LKFIKCKHEHGVYEISDSVKDLLIACHYVDDLLVIGTTLEDIMEFKKSMKEEFELTDLGSLSHFLGLEFKQVDSGILMHQKKYALSVLKRFNMPDCNSVLTPVEVGTKLVKESNERLVESTLYKQIVGSLMYLCHSRPNICYGVRLISRYMDKPRVSDMIAAKCVLRYIKGTMDFGVFYPNSSNCCKGDIVGFTDSTWRGDVDDGKSITGHVFMFCDAPIS